MCNINNNYSRDFSAYKFYWEQYSMSWNKSVIWIYITKIEGKTLLKDSVFIKCMRVKHMLLRSTIWYSFRLRSYLIKLWAYDIKLKGTVWK